MTVAIDKLTQPASNADYTIDTGHKKLGLGIGFVGLMISMIAAILVISAGLEVADGGSADTVGQLLTVAFGLNTLALATLKVGIGVVLVGILVRLWWRIESIKASLPAIQAEGGGTDVPKTSPAGDFTVSETEPAEMPIHKMAKTLWAPMLAMGYMLVVVGLVAAIIAAVNVGTDQSTATGAWAWAQGLQFLGEAFVLAGISFLLATILRGLRQGGGQVQQALGIPVLTLKMPATAKGGIALMVSGVMLGIVQLIGYITVTTFETSAESAVRVGAWFAALGPLRELSLGLLLAGIVLFLATIGTVLQFQFWRIRSIVTSDTGATK
jgi:hypothetical protein